MRKAGALGVAGVDPKASMRAVQERAQTLAAEQAPLDSRERLTALGISVLRGETRFVDAMTLAVDDVQVRPQAIVLAVGGDAILPCDSRP